MKYNELEVLLVEDDPDDLELTLHTLAEARISNPIHVARDGQEALDYIFRRGVHARWDQFQKTIREMGYYWLVVNQPKPSTS
jgi:CheY-like chemotaxis protein